jgi:hypothetical protein
MHRRALVAGVAGLTFRQLLSIPAEAAAPAPTSDEDWTATLLAMPMPADDAPLPIRLAWRYVRLATCQKHEVDGDLVGYIDNLITRGSLESDMSLDQAIAEGRFRVDPLPHGDWPYFDVLPNSNHPCHPPIRPGWNTDAR